MMETQKLKAEEMKVVLLVSLLQKMMINLRKCVYEAKLKKISIEELRNKTYLCSLSLKEVFNNMSLFICNDYDSFVSIIKNDNSYKGHYNIRVTEDFISIIEKRFLELKEKNNILDDNTFKRVI